MQTANYSAILRKSLPFIASLLAMLLIISCGDSNDSIKTNREPTDLLIAELANTEYSIVLNDMNVSDLNSKTHYQHKYHVLKLEKDSLVVDSMDWQTVNRAYFEKHENDLGMEVVSNHNGKLSKVARPVGFGWAIGNEEYGEWEPVTKDSTSTASNDNNSRRRWRSNGPSLLFWYWMLRRPAYQRDYNGYRSAAASGKSYYGTQTNGKSTYGTNSSYQRNKRSSFFSRKSSSNSWKSHTQQKTKRSSSRYNNGSSTRSRSGGFGK